MGQAPDRQAALFAGLPTSVPCTAVNKVWSWFYNWGCKFPNGELFLGRMSRSSDPKSRIIDSEPDLDPTMWLLIAEKNGQNCIVFNWFERFVFLHGFLHIFMANSEIMSRIIDIIILHFIRIHAIKNLMDQVSKCRNFLNRVDQEHLIPDSWSTLVV